jgi:hypothetical protein
MFTLLLTLCSALTSQVNLNPKTADLLEARATNLQLLADHKSSLFLGGLALAKEGLPGQLLLSGALGERELLGLPPLAGKSKLLSLGSTLALQGRPNSKTEEGLNLLAVLPTDKDVFSLGGLALAKEGLPGQLLLSGALGERELLGLRFDG